MNGFVVGEFAPPFVHEVAPPLPPLSFRDGYPPGDAFPLREVVATPRWLLPLRWLFRDAASQNARRPVLAESIAQHCT